MEDTRLNQLERKMDSLETKIEGLETKIEASNQNIEGLRDDLQRLLFYMNNDGQTGRRGIVAEMEELKKTISDLLTREKVYRAKAGVWGIVGGIIVTAAIKLITVIIPFIK